MGIHQILLAVGSGTTNLSITISSNTTNMQLRNLALANSWNGTSPINFTVTIPNGVVVGSSSTASPAISSQTGWPVGSTITINNSGYIVGAGGKGGNGSGWQTDGEAGGNGGNALEILVATIINNAGVIGGGGGGGGGSDGTASPDNMYGIYGAGGGGGAGSVVGGRGANAGGSAGVTLGAEPTDGTLTTGGTGGVGASMPAYGVYAANGGNGGGLGQNGVGGGNSPGTSLGPDRVGGAGGLAGAAVVGNAFITWQATGTRYGALT